MNIPLMTLAFSLTTTALFADSPIPACSGTVIPKGLQGRWVSSTAEGPEEALKIGQDSITTLDEDENKEVTHKAWYCVKDKMEFVVIDFGEDSQDGRYESRAIAGSFLESYDGRNLYDLGEAFPQQKEGEVKVSPSPELRVYTKSSD